ncbi:MAG TPA: hypothetical protein H9894_04340 [Candidatus Desulfovibrio intestinipullorum]|uniref:Uncharacterized protein n=1 Tax=Candidatus Desulfovibrio intestinipullorum TaxID=2838536 RepID=A0A9D1PW43_9BACT|nr:hypothetical protein [Candidatus Desulfovibrio intestinipullorum]
MNIVNLEPLCASYGMILVEEGAVAASTKATDRENVITKALGVLVEKGIYAMTIFLMTSNCPDYSKHVLRKLAALLADDKIRLLPQNWQKGTGDLLPLLEGMRTITEELPRLLLARKVLEETLTFARYHCKALSRLQGA